MKSDREILGTGNIRKLLLKQTIPASIGILFMTVNLLVDTILVGRWVGSLAIAALTVVTPIAFLLGSVGFAIGFGGSSVLSRALGSKNLDKAKASFAHQIVITCLILIPMVAIGSLFPDEVLTLFGAKGDIIEPAKIFYYPILLATPLQALCAVGNSVMRAEDNARFAMISLIIPSIGNILLDVLFIKIFGWGIFGAAMATAVSYAMCFLFAVWYFISKSDIVPKFTDFVLKKKLTTEISSLSLTTFARQGVIGILSVLLNNSLFTHGGELAVVSYGIISKLLMFALFPVNGVVEGFMPVAGFNYGAQKFDRVKESVFTSIKMACGFAVIVYVLILIFAEPIVYVFTDDAQVILKTPNALRWVFAASPVIAIQLIGAAYFQSAGKAGKALMLTLSKQGFFLIPLILILPDYFGIFGIWIAFPIADLLSTLVTGLFLRRALHTNFE